MNQSRWKKNAITEIQNKVDTVIMRTEEAEERKGEREAKIM